MLSSLDSVAERLRHPVEVLRHLIILEIMILSKIASGT